ncbi:cytochrome P450 2J4-like [Antedon mediterranea]|uniref:cytochrome P450 2J4-like n=1 Tax=Antedon mediterranea TaxID=105859 RepID=UPI003AF911F1
MRIIQILLNFKDLVWYTTHSKIKMALIYDNLLSLISIQNVVLLVFVILLALWLLKSNNNLPPGPRGWPIIGSIPYMFGEPHETFEEWTRIYGDIFTVKLGRETVVILNGSDVVKQALKDQGERFIDRKIIPIVEFGYTIKGGIAFRNGHPWLELRRWSSSFLRDYCHGKKGLLGRQLNLESQLTIEAEHLCQEFGKREKPFNPFHCINNAVSNIISIICFGDRFEYNDPKYKELLEGLGYLFDCTGFVSALNAFPILYYTPVYKQFRKTLLHTKSFLNDIIKRHEETFDSEDIRDIIDAYLLELQKDDVDTSVFSKDVLWRTILDLFVAGTDTVTSTLAFTIAFLVNYPEVQKKLQKEVDEVIGQKKPKWSDRHSMPYLEATIMEIQRLGNVVPFFGRRTSDCVKINGYEIPADTTVLVNLFSVHRHSDKWARPLNFEPDRFLDDLKNIQKQEALLPFGIGRRLCIGELMAKMELFLFTANLIQRFQFKVPEGRCAPSVHDCLSGITRRPKPFEICAIKR